MSFLALSAELRIQVYGYAVSLEEMSFSYYVGLYMSCRQIKREIDHEGARIHCAQLSRMIPKMLGVRIEMPTSFRDCRYLRLSLSTSYHHRGRRTLHCLFALHLGSIEITWDEDDRYTFYDNRIYMVTHRFPFKLAELNTGRMVIHRPYMHNKYKPRRESRFTRLWRYRGYEVIVRLLDSELMGKKWEWVTVYDRIGGTQPVRLLKHGDVYIDRQHNRKEELRAARVRKTRMRILCSIMALIVTYILLRLGVLCLRPLAISYGYIAPPHRASIINPKSEPTNP
jgi:hypothetical protein